MIDSRFSASRCAYGALYKQGGSVHMHRWPRNLLGTQDGHHKAVESAT